MAHVHWQILEHLHRMTCCLQLHRFEETAYHRCEFANTDILVSLHQFAPMWGLSVWDDDVVESHSSAHPIRVIGVNCNTTANSTCFPPGFLNEVFNMCVNHTQRGEHAFQGLQSIPWEARVESPQCFLSEYLGVFVSSPSEQLVAFMAGQM